MHDWSMTDENGLQSSKMVKRRSLHLYTLAPTAFSSHPYVRKITMAATDNGRTPHIIPLKPLNRKIRQTVILRIPEVSKEPRAVGRCMFYKLRRRHIGFAQSVTKQPQIGGSLTLRCCWLTTPPNSPCRVISMQRAVLHRLS